MLLFRRGLALGLVAAAGLSALHSARGQDPEALVLVREVAAGETLNAADLSPAPVPEHLQPAQALTKADAAVGRVAASTLLPGTVATELSFVGPTLVEKLVPDAAEPANMVPLKLAEPEVIPLLRHGDTVTIVSHREESTEPRVIAAGGRIILAAESAGAGPATVLVALPESAAREVAAAALHSPLAVVLTGDRAQI